MKKSKNNKEQRNLICILLLAFIFVSFIFFNDKTKKVNLNSKEIYEKTQTMISHSQINKFVSSQQNVDGGFSLATPNLDSDLPDTYYAINCLKIINKKLDFIHTKQYIKNTNVKRLLNKDNIYSLKNCFYYLKLNMLLDINVPKNDLEQIIDFTESLKTNEGFFYNTAKDERKEGREYLLDPYYLETLLYGHKILSSYNNDNNIGLQEEFLKCIDFNEYSTDMCALISTYVEISTLYDYCNAKYIDKLENYLQNYIKNGFKENIGYINDVFAIARYINYDVSNILVGFTKQLWSLNGYSIDKYSDNVSIKATNQVLHILNEFDFNLDSEIVEQIYKFIICGEKYNGTYTFSDRESDMFSSYYAVEILELMKCDNELELYKLTEFLDSKKNIFDDLPTSEQFFYLKTCKISNYDTSNIINRGYFDTQFEILKKVDIVNNAELVILLLEVADIYDYKIPKYIQTLIIDKTNIHSKKSTNKMVQFINECNSTYIKLLLQENIEEEEIYNLIIKFEKDIENWDDMLYAFHKVFKLVNLKNVDINFSEDIIYLVLSEIEKKMKDDVYMYSSSYVATFDSVYELFNILINIY